MSHASRRFPPIGIVLFCIAFGILLLIGCGLLLPRLSPDEDWIAYPAMIITGLVAGYTLRAFWLLKRWSVIPVGFFILLIEAATYVLGPPEKLAAISIRTGLWLLLLVWAYGANRKHFT